MKNKIKCWIEAMRLRTLPVSVAGVIMAIGYACADDAFYATPAILCLLFAVLAQVASNFANEYYDYKAGLDKPGREGPRRGVTEGDICPAAMLAATYLTLGAACAIGCSLIYFSGWWLIPIGLIVALGVIAYSTGPYPLSHHGLGEAAVVLFFGIVPVNMTFYLQTGVWTTPVLLGSISAGLMGANVLIVNNYRDADADKAVGKHTLAVLLGRKTVAWLYLANGYAAVALTWKSWMIMPAGILAIPVLYLMAHTAIWAAMHRRSGHRLTPLLGMTAMAMLFYSGAFAVAAACL